MRYLLTYATIQSLRRLSTSQAAQVLTHSLSLSVHLTVLTSSHRSTGKLVPPPLAFDILDEIMEKLPGFPIVLHGSSSVPQEYVDMINEYGGKLPDAVGIPEEQLRKASASAVCKINIDSDSRLAFTAAVRKVFHDKPGEFDPRKYCGPARDLMEQMYKHKITDVLGSDGKLAQC